MLNDFKKYMDFFPFLLVGLLLIKEEHIEKHAIDIGCQTAINIIIYVIFFIGLFYIQNKILIVMICIILWISLIYFKKNIITNLLI
jgi:hypothetical protein